MLGFQGLTVTKYIKIGNEIIASKKDGVGRLFYHNDHLGGVNVITDASAVKVQLNEYDPWGKVSRSEGSTDPTHRFTACDSLDTLCPANAAAGG